MDHISDILEGNYLLLLIFLLPLLYFIFNQAFKSLSSSKNIPQLPPGPTPWPILGNIPHMGKLMLHITLSNLAQIYGPLISLRLGTQHIIVGSSPGAAIEILKIQDRILSARYVPKALPCNQEELNHSSIGWTEACNDGWKYLRTLCKSELFAIKALDNSSRLREKKIVDLIEHLRGKEGEVVNIGDLVFATVFNMLSNVFVSRDLIGLEEKSEDGGMKGLVRAVVENAAIPNISDFYPTLQRLDLQGIRKKSMKVWIKIRAIWEPIIEEKRTNGASLIQEDFLDTLLHNNFTNDRIHQLLMELFAAGTDTSTSTIEWMMAELVKNPESMKKLHEELDKSELVNQDSLKESIIMKLPYLQACVKETLRLHPPAPLLLPHRALETCQVMKYQIPKNSQVLVNVWAIGRDPLVWNDPLKFKPERFLDSIGLDYKGNDFEFLPFGGGRRICPGLPMAARTVPLVVASLIHCFDWFVPQGKDPQELDMNEKFGITLQKEQPLLLIPKSRK